MKSKRRPQVESSVEDNLSLVSEVGSRYLVALERVVAKLITLVEHLIIVQST